jgi:hypothetical protein
MMTLHPLNPQPRGSFIPGPGSERAVVNGSSTWRPIPGGVMMRQLVERYLHEHCHTLSSPRSLPETERRPTLAAAARYAALKMTEADASTGPATGRIQTAAVIGSRSRP